MVKSCLYCGSQRKPFMDVLNRVLDVEAGPRQPFIPSASFKGRKVGYVFKNGASGIGYYQDAMQGAASLRKRGREYEIKAADDDEDEEQAHSGSSSSSSNNGSRKKAEIERILAEADEEEIQALDAQHLKLLLVRFEKSINRNQELRIKHASAPDKYMDSELELHGVLHELYAVAASPELYSTLLQADSVTSILGMVTHDNTDVSIAAIGLLQEMTDAESVEGEERYTAPLLDRLLELQGLELVVLNLDRLDETNEEDAQGVFTTLTLVENLVALRPEVATLVCERTHILRFLLRRLVQKAFDGNKLYASEILSILLQGHESNQKRLLLLQEVDGVESLLQALAQYKKTDPQSLDEAECVQNIFLSLCSVLLLPEGQQQFRIAEGFELMARFLKETKFCAAGALRTLNYAILKSRVNCLKLIETGGLRYIFPLLAGAGLSKAYQTGKHSSDASASGPKITNDMDKRKQTETAVAITGQLLLHLHACPDLDASSRLLAKFTEANGDKLQHAIGLFAKTSKRLQQAERGIERTLEAAIAAGDDETVSEYGDEEVLYDLRLQAGLYELQQLAFMVAFVFIYHEPSRTAIDARLEREGGCIDDLLAVLREWAANIVVPEGGEEAAAVGSDGALGTGGADSLQRQTIISWCAALAQLAAAAPS